MNGGENAFDRRMAVLNVFAAINNDGARDESHGSSVRFGVCSDAPRQIGPCCGDAAVDHGENAARTVRVEIDDVAQNRIVNSEEIAGESHAMDVVDAEAAVDRGLQRTGEMG